VGTIEEHNKYGAEEDDKILQKYNYPDEKIELVMKCIYNHIYNQNESVEEEITADADVLAHFDNLSMLYYISLGKRRMNLEEAKKFVKNKLEFDYNKLSQYGKDNYKDRYEKIMKTLFGYNQVTF
ncbi:MAG: metal-dependent phosphohydrolase, partial [Bacilli bacterium]|nr:metal-dependent phosphohydrolase [Bacilli bacterium]